jgi:esterase
VDVSPTLVLVHGLGDQAASWQRFAAAMEPEVDVLALDLAGHGQAPPAADYRYAAFVDQVAHSVAGLERFALLGHSVGGAIAWLYAARNPQRVTHLILVEPAAPHQSPFLHGPTPEPRHPYTYASLAEATHAMRMLDPSVTEAETRRDYRQRSDGRWEPAFDPAIFPPLVEDAKAHAAEFRAELRSIRAPTLLVRGERSMASKAQLEEITGEIPKARLVSLPDAPHFMHRQQPVELASLVKDFLLRAGA